MSRKPNTLDLAKLEAIQTEFNSGAKKISLADLIVLAGGAAVEKAAKDGAREGAALVSATEVAEKLTVKVKEGGSDGTGD